MYVGGCFCKSSFFRLKLVLTLPLSLAFLPFFVLLARRRWYSFKNKPICRVLVFSMM